MESFWGFIINNMINKEAPVFRAEILIFNAILESQRPYKFIEFNRPLDWMLSSIKGHQS